MTKRKSLFTNDSEYMMSVQNPYLSKDKLITKKSQSNKAIFDYPINSLNRILEYDGEKWEKSCGNERFNTIKKKNFDFKSLTKTSTQNSTSRSLKKVNKSSKSCNTLSQVFLIFSIYHKTKRASFLWKNARLLGFMMLIIASS